MIRKSLAVLVVAVASLVSSQSIFAEQNSKKDVDAIGLVVEQFRTSIINKDKPTFISLFYSDKPELVTWQFVADDARIKRFQEKFPEARKARHLPNVNYLAFIDTIVAKKQRAEEKFSNIQIRTDGEIGSVSFDYSYVVEEKEENWGYEMWHLVRTEKGWKIISVIFSVRDPVQPKEM
jgi:hypothetical protein